MASVTLEHLSKIYSNGFVSVNDVSLRVDNGEFITLHGPSGCGKSTILRMIGGLEDITSGKIYLSDELLNDILPRDRRLAWRSKIIRFTSILTPTTTWRSVCV